MTDRFFKGPNDTPWNCVISMEVLMYPRDIGTEDTTVMTMGFLRKLDKKTPFDILATYHHEDKMLICSLYAKSMSAPFMIFEIITLRCKAGLTLSDPLDVIYYFLEDFNLLIEEEKTRIYKRFLTEY